MWYEAAKINVLGITVYAFGLYVMAGAIAFSAAAAARLSIKKAKTGTAPVLVLLSLLIGMLCSRLAFCLMDMEFGSLLPFRFWPYITAGGWSMMGLVGGVFLAAFLCARLTGQKPWMIIDCAVSGLCLFITAERVGEQWIPDFDISRTLDSEWLASTFLSVGDEYDSYLATFKLAAIAAFVLFIFLTAVDSGKRETSDGDLTITFLLFFGAGSIILESLRYDLFLSYSFVGLQHIIALVILTAGVFLASARWKGKTAVRTAAAVSLLTAAAIALALEFALDRSTINKFIIYSVMTILIFIPAVLGFRMLRPVTGRKGSKQ